MRNHDGRNFSLTACAVALLAWAPVKDGDSFIYAATGARILRDHAVPHHDTFSWTQAGRPWQSNGWAWAVVLHALDVLGGLRAMVLTKPVLLLAIVLVTKCVAQRNGARSAPASVAAVGAGLLLTSWVTERPQMVSYLCFVVLIGAVSAALGVDPRRSRLRRVLVVGAVTVLWTNLHSAALAGVFIVAAMGAGYVLRGAGKSDSGPRTRVAVAVAVLGAAVLGTACTPYGLSLYGYSREVQQLSSRTITEWFPLWQASDRAIPVAVIACVLVAGWRWRLWTRMDALMPVLLLTVLAVVAIRNAPFLYLGAALFLSPLVPDGCGRRFEGRADLAAVGSVAFVVIAALLAVPRALESSRPDASLPVGAVDALPSHCQLRNDYLLGGLVIFRRPDVAVSADGRNDLYRLDGYEQNQFFEVPGVASTASKAFEAEGTTCVLAFTASPIVQALESHGWIVRWEGPDGILLVRSVSAGHARSLPENHAHFGHCDWGETGGGCTYHQERKPR